MTEMKRIILEMGTGNDLHGGDYTKAAKRAVRRSPWLSGHTGGGRPAPPRCRAQEPAGNLVSERFGLGPKAYYSRLRLNEVRQELLAGSPSDVIAEIANRNGFWHMGQFAKEYRRFFGELPSETLRARSR